MNESTEHRAHKVHGQVVHGEREQHRHHKVVHGQVVHGEREQHRDHKVHGQVVHGEREQHRDQKVHGQFVVHGEREQHRAQAHPVYTAKRPSIYIDSGKGRYVVSREEGKRQLAMSEKVFNAYIYIYIYIYNKKILKNSQ